MLARIGFKVRVLVSHKLWQDILATKSFGTEVCFVSGVVYPASIIGLKIRNILKLGLLRQQYPAEAPPLFGVLSSVEQLLPRP